MGLASTRRNGMQNAHRVGHISALIPKCSLNLLSLVCRESTLVLERAATNVPTNVQKTAGSTGIGIVVAVDEEAFVGVNNKKIVLQIVFFLVQILRGCEKNKNVFENNTKRYKTFFFRFLGTVVQGAEGKDDSLFLDRFLTP